MAEDDYIGVLKWSIPSDEPLFGPRERGPSRSATEDPRTPFNGTLNPYRPFEGSNRVLLLKFNKTRECGGSGGAGPKVHVFFGRGHRIERSFTDWASPFWFGREFLFELSGECAPTIRKSTKGGRAGVRFELTAVGWNARGIAKQIIAGVFHAPLSGDPGPCQRVPMEVSQRYTFPVDFAGDIKHVELWIVAKPTGDYVKWPDPPLGFAGYDLEVIRFRWLPKRAPFDRVPTPGRIDPTKIIGGGIP